MAKKGGKGNKGNNNRVPIGQLTPEQLKAFQAQLGLQDRAFEMAQAQADRDYEAYLRRVEQQRADAEAARQAEIEDAQRAAQFSALENIANIYGKQQQDIQGQGAAVAKQYEDQMAGLRSSFDAQAAQVKQAYDDQLAGLTKRSGETSAAFAARKNAVESSFANMISGLQNQFDAQAAQIAQQREESLAQLQQGIARGESTIGEAESALLRDLVATRGYSEAPITELGQVENPLLAGLQAEGAGVGGVQGESEQARQAAAQLAAMSRGAMRQLNVGEENYLKALQNAGRFAAAQSRQDLAVRGATIGQGIRSRYDELANQVAMSRMAAIQQAEAQRQAELGALGEREFSALGDLDAASAATKLAALQAQASGSAERDEALRRLQQQGFDVGLGLSSSAAEAAAKAAEARAQAQGFSPITRTTPMPMIPEPAFDYAANLEAARKAALAAIQAALPSVPKPTVTPKPTVAPKPNGKKGTKKVTDPWTGTSYIPNEYS